MNLIIDTANTSDFYAVNSIVKEGQDEHAEALPHIFKKIDQVMPESYFQELLEEPDFEILVARENGEVVAFAVMEIKEAPPFESMTQRKYAYIINTARRGNRMARLGCYPNLF